MKTVMVLATALLICSQSVFADADKITQGTMRCFPDHGDQPVDLPLKHTDVNVEISGFVTRVHVVQTFSNPYNMPIEAVYVFPLPQDSAVSDMQITVGDRVIKGQIQRREDARRIYENAKRAGKTAALLDQERPNIFSQSVANIMPGHEILVEITYDDVLTYQNGGYEFVFPMVVGPRFIPSQASVPDASLITPPALKPGERNGHDISLSVKVDAGVTIRDIASPTHQVEINRTGTTPGSTCTVRLSDKDTVPNKDFVLRYKVAGPEPEFGLLTHCEGRDGYFMLMFQPPDAPAPDAVMPKEMVFVVDCSGSMNGEPISLAKKAVRYALQNLNADDTFQIIRFSESASPFSPTPLPATKENIRRGLSYINDLEGEGPTMAIEGIKAALDYPNPENRLRIVSFMTDGYIGNEAEILDAIGKKLGDNTRLFSFGVGSSVNRYLLDSMAQVGRGAVEYVTLNENPEASVNRFYERVRNPVLTHIRIDWSGLDVSDLSPARIPDVFAGQPIMLLGRYDHGGDATIQIHAKLGGRDQTYPIRMHLPDAAEENGAVAALWARSRIKELSSEQFGGEKPSVVQAITDLALKYRLMSQYTSFVAVEDKIVNEGGNVKTIQIPVEMPEGVSYQSIFGDEEKDISAAAPACPQATRCLSSAKIAGGCLSMVNQAQRTEPAESYSDKPDDNKKAEMGPFALAWKTSAGTMTVSEAGEVWVDQADAHVFVTRLTQDQKDKLARLLAAALAEGSTAVRNSIVGTLKVSAASETSVHFGPRESHESEAWQAVVEFLDRLAA